MLLGSRGSYKASGTPSKPNASKRAIRSPSIAIPPKHTNFLLDLTDLRPEFCDFFPN